MASSKRVSKRLHSKGDNGPPWFAPTVVATIRPLTRSGRSSKRRTRSRSQASSTRRPSRSSSRSRRSRSKLSVKSDRTTNAQPSSRRRTKARRASATPRPAARLLRDVHASDRRRPEHATCQGRMPSRRCASSPARRTERRPGLGCRLRGRCPERPPRLAGGCPGGIRRLPASFTTAGLGSDPPSPTGSPASGGRWAMPGGLRAVPAQRPTETNPPIQLWPTIGLDGRSFTQSRCTDRGSRCRGTVESHDRRSRWS